MFPFDPPEVIRKPDFLILSGGLPKETFEKKWLK